VVVSGRVVWLVVSGPGGRKHAHMGLYQPCDVSVGGQWLIVYGYYQL
jgi:hypothetical protein